VGGKGEDRSDDDEGGREVKLGGLLPGCSWKDSATTDIVVVVVV
jgi:hypothetical protein